MTCIAAIKTKNEIWMGADSCCGSDFIRDFGEPKVFEVGEFLIGVCGYVRIINILRHRFYPPEQGTKQSISEYLCTTVQDHLREIYTAVGYIVKKEEFESTVDALLVGYRGKLVHLSNFEAAEFKEEYASVGSGSHVASGALFALKNLHPKKRIQVALEAAEHHISTVRRPFVIRKRSFRKRK